MADRGFTLLEVLVAFAIMSLVLVPIFQGGSESLGSVAAATRMEVAVALARSRLSLFDAIAAPTAEELQGEEGGYHWRLQVSPAGAVPVVGGGQATTLYRVAVTMTWRSESGQSGRRESSIRLETLRLTPVAPAPP